MITRNELNQSNSANILGPGKINPTRHSNHNQKIADYIDSLKATVDTYADMITLCTGSKPIGFLVLNDENKSQQNTTYQYFPNPDGDPTLMWMASVKEEL